MRVGHDLLTGAAQDQLGQPTKAARAHDDDVTLARFRHVDDGLGGTAFDDLGVNFAGDLPNFLDGRVEDLLCFGLAPVDGELHVGFAQIHGDGVERDHDA